METVVDPHLNEFKSPSSNDDLCQVWWIKHSESILTVKGTLTLPRNLFKAKGYKRWTCIPRVLDDPKGVHYCKTRSGDIARNL